MIINKLSRIGFGVAIGALILGILGACSSDSNISSDTTLEFEEKEKVFDPKKVYGNTPNSTKL